VAQFLTWIIGGTALHGYKSPEELQQFVEGVDKVAQHLQDTGAVMYGRDGCIWTQRQKLLFGPSFHKVKYVQCDVDPKSCAAAGVRGVPQWTVSGKTLFGYQTMDSLLRTIGPDAASGRA
jgi:hypothetical protein